MNCGLGAHQTCARCNENPAPVGSGGELGRIWQRRGERTKSFAKALYASLDAVSELFELVTEPVVIVEETSTKPRIPQCHAASKARTKAISMF